MSRVPRIRFKGFEEDWEQRKLGEYLIQYTEVTIINDQYPVLTSSRKGIFFQKDYYDGNQIASENNIGYNIVPYGYFTYRHMSDDEIFYFNINNIIDNGIVSTLYPVFTTNNRLDSKFLQYELNFGKEFRKYSVLQKQGGSRTYMYFNKLRDLKLTITTSLKEQECIRNLICSIDHLITLHQRKLEKLKIIKKSMLENLFPQNGEKTPKIRFSGFNEDWEQRKLGELYELVNEKNDGSYSKDSNITVSTMQFKSNIQISKNEYLNTYNIFKKGYIAFEGHKSKEFRFGRFVENDIGDGIVSHIFIVFRPIMEFDINFWKYAINNELIMQSILSRATKASTMMNDLVVKDFLKEIFFVPSVGEQACIGKTLKYLDHLITLHQLEPFQLIFKAIAYRIIDYAKSKPPRCRKYTGFIAFINTMYKNCVYTQYNHLYSLKSYYIKDIILLIKSAYICKIII